MEMASGITLLRVKWRRNYLSGPEVKRGCKIQFALYLSDLFMGLPFSTVRFCSSNKKFKEYFIQV